MQDVETRRNISLLRDHSFRRGCHDAQSGAVTGRLVTDMISKSWTILVSFVKGILSMIVNHI